MGNCCGLLLVLAASIFAAAQSQAVPQLSAAGFAQEMRRVRAQVEELEKKPQSAPALIAGLPKSWKVQTAQSEVEISADFVRAGVASFQKVEQKDKTSRLNELEASLDVLQSQAKAYDGATPIPAETHWSLARILDAPEFRGLKGPSQLQLLWQRVLSWLQKQWDKLFPRMPSATNAGPVFAWCLIAVVCSALGVWIYRRSRQTELQPISAVIPYGPGAKGWRNWLEEARESAGRGAWRDAIHLAFWAGVAKLEAEGTWRPDRTRTPREYLRAIPEWNAARLPFQLAMHSFERSWYGRRPASADDFQQILAALERMGCR
jgi:hypothetical protein